MPQLLDLPSVFESAYRTREMKNRVEDQDKARSLNQILNRNTDPRTGQLDPQGVRKAAGAQGQGFNAEQVLTQMDEATRARVKSRLEEMDSSAWALLDEYNDNLKKDPKTADAKLQMSYDKLTVNNPNLYALKQGGQLPSKINHTQIVAMLGKHQYHYEFLRNLEEKTKVDKKKAETKKAGSTKETEAERNMAAVAQEYDLEIPEVRAVYKSYKTLAEENFPKALAKYRLERGSDDDGHTPGQKKAFDTLRNNPKNKDYSDEELWSAISAKRIQ